MKFLVLTQDDGVAPASITAQTSAARSYLATQRHAHRRSLKTSATREQHEVTWRRDTVSTTSYVDLPSVEPYPAPSTRQPALSTRMRLPRRSSTKSKTELPYEDAFDPFISSIRDTHDSLQPTSEYTSPEADHDSVNLRPDTSTEVDASFPGPSDHLSPINFQQRSPRFFLPHSIISTITASLDPFLHLPLKITAQEESVLHFFLTSGRRWLLGTSENPQCCPAMSLARSLMQVDPIYVLSHIVIGESVLSKMTHKPVRKHYYLRSAQMYKAINILLADQYAPFSQKLWALIQVAMVENTARRMDLQAIHTRALDDFVESYGGFAASSRVGMDDAYLDASSRLYAGQLARSVLPVPDFLHFKAVTARFILSLTSIWTWMHVLRANSSKYYESWTDSGPRPLSGLLNYLKNMVHQDQFEDTSPLDPISNRGAIFCILSINLTFVQCPASFDAILDFLVRAQQCMCATATISPRTGHELDNIHPAAAAYSISCTRSEVFPQNSTHTECEISQALADAHKVFYLLSKARRDEIITWLLESISVVASLRDNGEAAWERYSQVDCVKLQALEEELEESWRLDKKTGKY